MNALRVRLINSNLVNKIKFSNFAPIEKDEFNSCFMDIEGKIIRDLGETSGTSKAGRPWKKHEWVIETPGTYPRQVKVQVFGEKADTINLIVGKDYILSVDIESREFQERWYTDVSIYRAQEINTSGTQPVSPLGVGQEMQPPYGNMNNTGYVSNNPFPPMEDNGSDEDLPF